MRARIIVIALTIIGVILLLLFLNNEKKLPDLPKKSGLTAPVYEQIRLAHLRASLFPTASNTGKLAMIHNSCELYSEATGCYKLAIRKDPDNWVWHYYLGYLNIELGNTKAVYDCFYEVAQINASAYHAVYHLGASALNLGQEKMARNHFTYLAELNDDLFINPNLSRSYSFPLPVYARYELARMDISVNEFDRAEKNLQGIIKNHLNFGPAYRQLSILYAKAGNNNLSNHYASRANDLNIYANPTDTLIDKLSMISRSQSYLLKQIDIAIRSSNSKWAIELIEHGLDYLSEDMTFVSKAIKQYLAVGMKSEAISYLEKHREYFGLNETELSEVGVLLINAGLISEAKAYFLKAEALIKDDAVKRSELVIFLFQAGAEEKALSIAKELLQTSSNNYKVLRNITYAFVEMKKIPEASELIVRIKELSSNQADALILEAMMASVTGDVARHRQKLEEAFKLEPSSDYILENLGTQCIRDQNWKRAIAVYSKALEHHPNNSYFQEKLGGLLIACPETQLRNLEKGIEWSERAYINQIYTIPTLLSAGENLALGYHLTGNKKLASLYIYNTIEIANRSGVPQKHINRLRALEDMIGSG